MKWRSPNLRFLQNRMVQHILFWCVSFYFLLKYFSFPGNIYEIDVAYTAIFHISLIAGVYLNLIVLIPRLFAKQRYLVYLFLSLLLVGVTAQLNILIFESFVDYILPDFFFISNFGFFELLEFGLIYHVVTSLLKLSKAWFHLQTSRVRETILEKEGVYTELQFLKMQINPHSLFNSLNNIYALILKKDPRASAGVLQLASTMRYMIYETNDNKVLLSQEIKYINSYIDLQRLTVSESAAIRFIVEGDVSDQMIAPLIFIVFIENAFKHGLKASIEQPYVNIKIMAGLCEVKIEVENSKGFVDRIEKDKHHGVGLVNARRRLDLLYPDAYSLQILDEKNVHRTSLTLQICNDEIQTISYEN